MTSDTHAQVLAIVRTWALQNPDGFTSAHGSTLDMAHVEVTAAGIDQWHVYVPEVAPMGLPMGLELLVNLRTGGCKPCDVE